MNFMKPISFIVLALIMCCTVISINAVYETDETWLLRLPNTDSIVLSDKEKDQTNWFQWNDECSNALAVKIYVNEWLTSWPDFCIMILHLAVNNTMSQRYYDQIIDDILNHLRNWDISQEQADALLNKAMHKKIQAMYSEIVEESSQEKDTYFKWTKKTTRYEYA